MFHKVKVLDRKGKVKKVVKGYELSRKFWNRFYEKEKNLMADRDDRISYRTRQKIEAEHPDIICGTRSQI